MRVTRKFGIEQAAYIFKMDFETNSYGLVHGIYLVAPNP